MREETAMPLGAHDEGKVCQCISRHNPAPMELNRHHIWPLGMGGPDTEDNIAWLCPTTHANVHELMRFILNGTLTDWRSALDMYEEPVNRYSWELAVDGIKRFREGSRRMMDMKRCEHTVIRDGQPQVCDRPIVDEREGVCDRPGDHVE